MFPVLASVIAGYQVAFEVMGGTIADDLFSPEQKRLLEAAYKRKRDKEAAAASAASTAWAAAKHWLEERG